MSEASANKIILMGKVGAKVPLLRQTPAGDAVTSFSLSTVNQWMGEGGKRKETKQWHTIEAWKELAELCCRNLKEGSRVYVEGKLVYSMEEKNGVRCRWAKIKISECQFL